ncbi:hypothetical protein [Rheinheimera maricola]|uniref:Uncharacterized protein n=1 Tax=Rheinheimera maricola TaxID=2793282 RepID=A0ABS7XC46_9GAMM|nr:hypothetical protein [Rheinheimera maricola]MBZ9613133.1 hypothetical protein [Rheinheimera maricola]
MDNTQQAQHLYYVYAVCQAAQHFFQQAAQQINNSNLRYNFLELSRLHQSAARRLPATAMSEPDHRNQLAVVEFWYLHQCAALYNPALQPLIMAELEGLLQQQLQGLKQLIKQVSATSAKITLAHFSAALQIAIDRLAPLLKVLPTSGQKIQTKN